VERVLLGTDVEVFAADVLPAVAAVDAPGLVTDAIGFVVEASRLGDDGGTEDNEVVVG
jgi:hypothetical protein